MKFSFVTGLTLRHGARTLELVRQLSEHEFVFEDVETRRPRTMNRYKTLKDIEAGNFIVVLPSLATLDSLDETPSYNATALPERIEKQIDRRHAYVLGMRKAGLTRGNRRLLPKVISAVSSRLGDSHPPSVSTVLDWAKRLESSGDNPRALVSKNYNRKSPLRKAPALQALIHEMIRKIYLTRKLHSIEHTTTLINREAERLVAEGKFEPEGSKVSPSTVGRQINTLDKYVVIKSRYGAARARMLCRTPMGDDYPEHPFEQVEFDHTPLDWIVLCDRTGIPLGRPLLTATICASTGYATGLYLSFYGPGLSSVSGVLRNTISIKDELCKRAGTENQWLASGVPDTFVLDNGLEFHALAFKRMARDAGSDLTYSRVRTPYSKPHVERFFAGLGTLTLTSGRVRKRITNVIELDPRSTAQITFSDLIKGLVRYFVDVHPFHINKRKVARPYDLMMEGIAKAPPARYLTSYDSIRLTTAMSASLTVSQGGIELRGIPYGTAELLPIRKAVGKNCKTLVKWDPDNIDEIFVQHPLTKEWVCSPSRWPHYTNQLSWNQHLLIRKHLREQLQLKYSEESFARSYLSLHDFWMEATGKTSRADAKLAAQFSGASSTRVFSSRSDEDTRSVPPSIILSDAANGRGAPREIPSFDSFEMP